MNPGVRMGPRPDAHGMSPRETEIMDRWEAGMARPEIAAELGIKQSYVDQIVRTYDFDSVLGGSLAFERMVRAGSRALEAAIRATGRLHS